jgi:rfaE bifunctional protein nucleotidyltransferase chain/domain
MSKIIDIVGEKFGRLLVEKYVGKDIWGKTRWQCKCECGNVKVYNKSDLSRTGRGAVRSCGCLKAEETFERCWHGHGEISGDFWSQIQRGAKSRGIDFNITIEEGWEIFLKQNRRCALSGLYIYFTKNTKKKRPAASLDRINSRHGYISGNIQWVHKKVNIMKNVFDNDEFHNLCELVTLNKKKGVKVVVASGGFDCLHIGHVEYLEQAAKLGNQLVVIVNTDEFLLRKKGYAFMPLRERMAIVASLRCVDEAVACIDKDQSVCETLRMIRPNIFCKGGDRNVGNIPEAAVCKELGIEIIDGLGAKIQSSSDLVKKYQEWAASNERNN